jgi:hypothetical protein
MNNPKILIYSLTASSTLLGSILYQTTNLISGPASYWNSMFMVFTVLTIAELAKRKSEVEA